LSGIEKRQHERVAAGGAAIRVRFNDVSDLEQYFIRDISRGGIFLRAKNLKPLQSQLFVVLAMPDGGEVKLRAEVVHVVSPEESTPQRPSGMGVQFLDLTPETKQQIAEYVERLKARSSAAGAAEGHPDVGKENVVAQPQPPQSASASRAGPVASPPERAAPRPEPAAAEPEGARESAEDERALLRRLCWLLAEGGVMGRPMPEVFGIGPPAPGVLREEVYERLRKALAPADPPRYLGAEEGRAVIRLLAVLESLTQGD